MNPRLAQLQPYPFERLATLLAGVTPNPAKKPIAWSIGEPKHAAPPLIAKIIEAEMGGLSTYPLTIGEVALREAIVDWLNVRFKLPVGSIDKDRHVLPCNGTREALFAFAQAVVDPTRAAGAEPLVLMPNPFYQIYEGAAFLAGAKPYYMNVDGETLSPDLDLVPESVWQQCQLIFLSTPGNPTGAVVPGEALKKLITLSDRFDFVIASDECYSELYPDENNPPTGLLQAAAELAGESAQRAADIYKNCVVFHSLSKRSNLPGMRSGFIAGDAEIMARFKLYRTYHGCAMSPPFQKASTAAWRDEEHVRANRELYRQKFAAVLEIIAPVVSVKAAEGAFYLWPQTPISDTEFARGLFEKEHLTVVPGSYLSRQSGGVNPGTNRVRMALVAPLDECVEGAKRFRNFVEAL
ncbi:MAG: succinyldiaminopimelate transaminase [Cyanobacteria bacterium REEB67]|nr:succinyldiaminopimelate transaminase [Cyanobacteria bacterium REEB67]